MYIQDLIYIKDNKSMKLRTGSWLGTCACEMWQRMNIWSLGGMFLK